MRDGRACSTTLYLIDRKPINICFTTQINISVCIKWASLVLGHFSVFFSFILVGVCYWSQIQSNALQRIKCKRITYLFVQMLMRTNSRIDVQCSAATRTFDVNIQLEFLLLHSIPCWIPATINILLSANDMHISHWILPFFVRFCK